MQKLALPMALISILLTGAVFGFFYAWVCSTMWGLDATDPRIAIAAMQAMNESVRNAVFFPAFFLTPAALFLTALFSQHNRPAAWLFAGAGATYALGGMILTVSVNVPMNTALSALVVPDDIGAARDIWLAYSPKWQVYNQIRTVASGAALLLTSAALWQLGQRA